ncbi:progranulin [Parasteatoda tepidariorum]|uniref:progranulin n=1 Tax=Parasteatoda tepidariorum TaxID=114398 RepID=UPI00077FB4A3|nr:progranulin [Parasteatoda tepidariorum]
MLPLYLVIVGFAFSSGLTANIVDNSTTFNYAVKLCPPWQTECQSGCCPYMDAVCCSDGFECCQHGQTCIPYIGICVGAELHSENRINFFTKKAVALKLWDSEMRKCPTQSTSCYDLCCPLQDAVCCPDREHCCPEGYQCSPNGCTIESRSVNINTEN